jgi:hypothetical protein
MFLVEKGSLFRVLKIINNSSLHDFVGRTARATNDEINVCRRDYAIAIRITGFKRPGALVAAKYRLEVLLLDKGRDPIIELRIAREPLFVEFIQAPGCLETVALGTGQNLVVNALDGIAGGAFRLDPKRLGNDMFAIEVYIGSAVHALSFGFDELPVLTRDLRPSLDPISEIPEGVTDEPVMTALCFGSIATGKRSLRNDLGVLVENQFADCLDILVWHWLSFLVPRIGPSQFCPGR